jgi:signal peptidase I
MVRNTAITAATAGMTEDRAAPCEASNGSISPQPSRTGGEGSDPPSLRRVDIEKADTGKAEIGEADDKGRDARRGGQAGVGRELLMLLLKVGVVILAGLLLFTFVYGLHRSVDPEMAPVIKDGDLVVFYRLDREYSAGDLVVLSYGGERQIRRVVATAGDVVDITEEGLIINGALQQEQEIYEATIRYAEGPPLPVTLNEGQVFVLGDSRENATDSRIYGPVDKDDTEGKVIAVMKRRNL